MACFNLFFIFIIRHGKIKHNDCFNYIYNIYDLTTRPSILQRLHQPRGHTGWCDDYEYFFLEQDVVTGGGIWGNKGTLF